MHTYFKKSSHTIFLKLFPWYSLPPPSSHRWAPHWPRGLALDWDALCVRILRKSARRYWEGVHHHTGNRPSEILRPMQHRYHTHTHPILWTPLLWQPTPTLMKLRQPKYEWGTMIARWDAVGLSTNLGGWCLPIRGAFARGDHIQDHRILQSLCFMIK